MPKASFVMRYLPHRFLGHWPRMIAVTIGSATEPTRRMQFVIEEIPHEHNLLSWLELHYPIRFPLPLRLPCLDFQDMKYPALPARHSRSDDMPLTGLGYEPVTEVEDSAPETEEAVVHQNISG